MGKRKDGFVGQKALVLPASILNTIKKNELTELLYITDIGFYPKAEGHYIRRTCGTDQNILIYCVDGEGWISVDGNKQSVKKNQFFVIEKGKAHSYAASDKNPWSIYWLHFIGSKSHLFRSMFNQLLDINITAESRLKDRIMLFEEIYQNLEMGYSTENLEFTSLCLWHFLASFRFISQYRQINKTCNGDMIQYSIKLMKEKLDQKFDLQTLASEVNYSTSRFRQLFLKKTGQTPLNYFNQLKIQKACQLLDFSDMRIKEIADQLGFYDQYHFSKVFVKIVGESPSDYRKRNKG